MSQIQKEVSHSYKLLNYAYKQDIPFILWEDIYTKNLPKSIESSKFVLIQQEYQENSI